MALNMKSFSDEDLANMYSDFYKEIHGVRPGDLPEDIDRAVLENMYSSLLGDPDYISQFQGQDDTELGYQDELSHFESLPKHSGFGRANEAKKNLKQLINEGFPRWGGVHQTPLYPSPTGLPPSEMDSADAQSRVKKAMGIMADFISEKHPSGTHLVKRGVTVATTREKLIKLYEEEMAAVHPRYVYTIEDDLDFIIGNLLKSIKKRRDGLKDAALKFALQNLIVGFAKNLTHFAKENISERPKGETK